MTTAETLLPMFVRAEGKIGPKTLNEAAGTVEVTWTVAGSIVRRRDWSGEFDEELVVSEDAIDMARLSSGKAPLLAAHSAGDLASVIGIVEQAWLSGPKVRQEGRARVRFSKRADVEPIVQDVRDGILRNVSVGYAVQEWTKTERKGNVPLMRATRWNPMEISLVPIGADRHAHVRSATRSNPEYQAMPLGTDSAVETVVTNSITPPDALMAERERCATILSDYKRMGLPEGDAERLIREGVSAAEAKGVILDQLAARQRGADIRNQHMGLVSGGIDHSDPAAIRARMTSALAHRLSHGRVPLPDDAREFSSATLLDMGRHLLEARGHRGFLGKAGVADMLSRSSSSLGGLMHTSDFALLMGDGAQRSLLAQFEVAAPALRAVARRETVPDFRIIRRLRLGEGSALTLVDESGEVERGTLTEKGESYQVATYAAIWGFTRNLIVNDDLSAFSQFITSAGTKAANTLGDLLAGALTANAVMADGTPWFHLNHGNLSATPAAITVASLNDARQLMRNQKGPDGTLVQVAPRYLVVSPAKETEAQTMLATLSPATVTNVNPFAGTLELVVEPRLAGNAWYLFSDPATAVALEYSELDGSRSDRGTGPAVETRTGFDVLGLELRVIYDTGVGVVAYQPAVKNAGN